MKNYPDDKLLTTAEAAEFLEVAYGTLNNWRSCNYGPEPEKIRGLGRRNFYKVSTLKEWKAKNVSK